MYDELDAALGRHFPAADPFSKKHVCDKLLDLSGQFTTLANDNDQFPCKPCLQGNPQQFLSLVIKRQSTDRDKADSHSERNQIGFILCGL